MSDLEYHLPNFLTYAFFPNINLNLVNLIFQQIKYNTLIVLALVLSSSAI